MKTTTKNILLFILNLVLLGICISMMLTSCKSNETAFATRDADMVFGGPVVAPTTQTTNTATQTPSSFGNENYIWDDWKLNDGVK